MHAKGKNKSSDGEFSLHTCIFLNNCFFIIGMVSHTYILWTKWILKQCFIFLIPLNCSNIPGNQVIFKSFHWFFFFEYWGKILKICFKVDLKLSLFSPSFHPFCGTAFQKRFLYLYLNQSQPFLNTKNLWWQELMCIKSNPLKLKFCTPSNSNMKFPVNKSAAGKYNMFFIHSSEKWWGECREK